MVDVGVPNVENVAGFIQNEEKTNSFVIIFVSTFIVEAFIVDAFSVELTDK